jgi:FMN phosphatase YigB (HAD superfamily)
MKNVLIDFDGVVFRNTKVSNMVCEKSIRYVASRKGLQYRDAKYVNDIGYTKLGHTARVVSDDTLAIQDYNEYVFDKQMFRWMKNVIGYSDNQLIEQVSTIKKDRNLRLLLCTNAPLQYCIHVLFYMGWEWDDVFDPDVCFTSDTGIVKPLTAYYNRVEDTLDLKEYHFIDDSISNIMPCIHRPRWKGCVINNQKDLFHYLNHI